MTFPSVSFKSGLLYSVAGLVALTVAFAFGRYTTPTRVEIKTEVIERVREVRTVQIQRVVDTKTRRVVVTKPDGSSIATEETHTREDTKADERAENEKVADTKSVTIKTGDKNWQVFATAGVSIPTPWNNYSSVAPTFGVNVNRRLFGPLWVGAWFQSIGAAGVSAGVEF